MLPDAQTEWAVLSIGIYNNKTSETEIKIKCFECFKSMRLRCIHKFYI